PAAGRDLSRPAVRAPAPTARSQASGSCATASISRRNSSRTRRLISTSVLAGRCGPKNSWRIGLMRGRCAASRMKIVTFATSAGVAPAASRMRFRLRKIWRVCSATSPTPTTPPASSVATSPDTYRVWPATTASEKWLIGSISPCTRSVRTCAIALGNLDDHLDLDRDAQRQRAHAYRGARVAPCIAERRDQQVRRAVDDLRLIGEVGRAVDHAEQLDHAFDLVQVADLLLENAETVQHHQLRRLAPGFHVEVLAQLADVVVLTVLAPRT